MLIRRDPFRDMVALRREIDRMFERTAGRRAGFGETQFPPMDVSETEDGVMVRALLPGMDRDSVKISLHQNVLTISGEKKATVVPEGAHVLRHERSSGAFQRTVRLPRPCDEEKVNAQLRDGVLTVMLPCPGAAKPKQIEVSVA